MCPGRFFCAKGEVAVGRRKRLGDILRERGLLTDEELGLALERQRETGEKLGEALINLGFISPENIADALSEHLGIPRVDFKRRYISSDVVRLIPESMIHEQQVLPVEQEGNFLSVAMVDPLNIMIIDDLQRLTGLLIRPMIATAAERRRLSAFSGYCQYRQAVFAQYGEDQSAAERQKKSGRSYFGDALVSSWLI